MSFEQGELGDYADEWTGKGADLSINQATYFGGTGLSGIAGSSRRRWGLSEQGSLYRHSYLYQVDYPIGRDDYGGIQCRARTWTTSETLPDELRRVVKQTAHRAAHMYDSSVQTTQYDGYLSGFLTKETPRSAAATAWEKGEAAEHPEEDAQLGRVDWNVEIYTDNSYADTELSGIAQGIARPWSYKTISRKQDVPQETMKLNYLPSRDEYEITTRSGTRARGQEALAGKMAYVNDKPIGVWKKNRGRQSIKAEYTRPPTARGRELWDRERLINETEATAQALRDGGNLYKVEETADAIYFVTAARKPSDFDPVPSDEIHPSRDVIETLERRLQIRGDGEPSALQCRRDEEILKHMGKSRPKYEHAVREQWRPL